MCIPQVLFRMIIYKLVILFLQSHIVAPQKSQIDENVQMQVRAVFMNCQIEDENNNFPRGEYTRSTQEELFRHGSLTNCKKKLALTIKITGDTAEQENFEDEYIPIEHVINGPNNKRIRLLNPYVLRLRREPPLQAYELRKIDTVKGVLTNTDYQEQESSNIKRQSREFHKQVGMNWYQNDNHYNFQNAPIVGGQELMGIENKVPNLESAGGYSNFTFKSRYKRGKDGADEQRRYGDGGLRGDFPQSIHVNTEQKCEKNLDYEHINSQKIKRGRRFKSSIHKFSEKKASETKPLLLLDSKLNAEIPLKVEDKITNNLTTIRSDFGDEGSLTEADVNTLERAYALYEIGNPDLWSTVHVQLFEKQLAPNGQIAWNDITKGESASVSSSLPDWGNPDMNVRYQSLDWVAREDFILPTSGLCLLTPLQELDRDNSEKFTSVKDLEYFILPMDAVINLEDSNNNVLKRYTNDSDSSSSTVKNNEKSRRRVQIRLSRALISGTNKTMDIVSRGMDQFLTLPYRRPCRAQIDLEAKADGNQLVTIGSSGRITTAVSDSTRPASTTLTIQATNNGLAAARFRGVVRECHPTLINEHDNKNAEELITNHVLIPPKHTRLLHLQVLNDIPMDSFHCSVALLNDYDEQVAVRDVSIKKGDRCFCVWHCDCVCLSEDPKLLCQEMPVSRQMAAGLSSHNQRRHARSICYNDVVTVDMFVIVIGVLISLLLLGLLKALFGLFIPSIRNWGLDRVLQTPRKLNNYYESSLSSRPVEYDDVGWPVHPDTKKRTVRLVSRPMEFVLNTIFFIVTPCLTVRNALKSMLDRCKSPKNAKVAKAYRSDKDTKKCFSSHDMQSVEPRWRRRRGGLRRWMTPPAEELSADIWRKALPSQKSIKCEFMQPLLHEHHYGDSNSVERQDSIVDDSEQEDTEYVLMQMQKSKESLRRSQRKLKDSDGVVTRNDSKSKTKECRNN